MTNKLLNILLISGIVLQITFFIGNSQLYNENHKVTENNTNIVSSIEEDTEKIPIFAFHRIVNDNLYNKKYGNNRWVHSKTEFEEQMKMLVDKGYKTISLDEFYCWYQKKCHFPEKTAMITIDDGDIEIYYEVLPILRKYNLKAVSFVIGNRTNEFGEEYNPDKAGVFIDKQLMNISQKIYPNLEYASHSYGLHRKESGKELVHLLNYHELEEDFSKDEINSSYLAYPYGAYNNNIKKVLKEKNYNLAFAYSYPKYATRDDDPYEISRIRIEGTMDIEKFECWLK